MRTFTLLHPCNSIPTILIQSVTLLTVCRYSNLHPHVSTAKLYPITTKRIYDLFHPCNSVSYYLDSKFHAITRLQILKSKSSYLYGKTISYYYHANLRSIPPMQFCILLSWFKVSRYYPISDTQSLSYYPHGKKITHFPMKHNTKLS